MPDTIPRRAVAREEAARSLNVGLSTLDTWIKQGTLRAVKVGRRVLIPTDAIDDFLRGQADDARR